MLDNDLTPVSTRPSTPVFSDENLTPTSTRPSTRVSNNSDFTLVSTRPSTPVSSNDKHTIWAYGEMSPSNLYFLPGLPPPVNLKVEEESKYQEKKSPPPFTRKPSPIKAALPSVIQRILPPSPSAAELSPTSDFERLISKYRDMCSSDGGTSPTRTVFDSQPPSPSMSVSELKPQKAVDKSVGIVKQQVAPWTKQDAVKERPPFQPISARMNAARPKKPFRGGTRLPPRPPLPRWDLYESTTPSKPSLSLVFTQVPHRLKPLSMNLQPRKLEIVEEEGWHIVSGVWWHTAYDSVSWKYSPDDENNGTNRWFRGSLFDAIGIPPASVQPYHADDDLVLNSDLCGVHIALDALEKYETDVGFPPMKHAPKAWTDISNDIDEDVIAQGRERWDSYAEALISGVDQVVSILENDDTRDADVSRTSSPSSMHRGLQRSTSTLSSADLTDSDMSLVSSSPPSTPKRRSLDAAVEVKDLSPVKGDHGRFIVPARPLNAAATSFVPSFSTSKPETDAFSFATPLASDLTSPTTAFSTFTFPKSMPQIKKDEEGFYSEATVEAPVPQSHEKETCTFLPPFLQSSIRRKGPMSKTRALVDRLRSHNHSHSPAPNAPLYDMSIFDERISVSEDDRTQNSGISSPSSLEDEDGWIDLSEADKNSKESKARRTRDLFLALTRRRSDSVPPQTDPPAQDDIAKIEFPMTTSPSSQASPLPSRDLLSQDDGWIDPSPAVTEAPHRRPESRSRSNRRRSSHAPLASPSALSSSFMTTSNATRVPVGHSHASFSPTAPSFASSHAAAPYFYSTYPTIMTPMAYTSYMQQLQLLQMQMRSSVTGSRRVSAPSTEWYQYPTASPPFMVAKPTTPAMRRDSLW
ncbi:hypothetical protein H0H93_015851 [Arthromyces matolae]|nr:hypothetical protein H0H93_015851 [Arthromyces matolae]